MSGDDPLARITALLKEKGATRCPMCRVSQWVAPKDWPYTRVPVEKETLAKTSMDAPFFPAYVLYCGNCGFVSLHMKHIVEPDEPPEDGETDDA